MIKNSNHFRVRFPLSLKVMILTAISVGLTALAIDYVVSKSLRETILENEVSLAREKATLLSLECEEYFNHIIEKSKSLGDQILNSRDESKRHKNKGVSVSRQILDPEIVDVEVDIVRQDENKNYFFSYLNRSYNDESYLRQYGLNNQFITILREELPKSFQIFATRKISIINSSLEGGAPLLTVGIPANISGAIVIADAKLEPLQRLFEKNSSTSQAYMVDDRGNIIAHSNDAYAFHKKLLNKNSIVEEALIKDQLFDQKVFESPGSNEEKLVGAYRKTAFGPIIIVQKKMSLILEPITRLHRQIFLTSAAAFFILLLIWNSLLARLTTQIKRISEASKKISTGNLDVRVPINSNDELGELSQSFDDMIDGLKTRK
jgi:nitrogen fixation/metabolism regulation signal transduction histidine kinase